MDKDFKKQEKRIKAVFSPHTEDISRSRETIKIYKNYLGKNLSFPIKLTGIEDFQWEEFYVLGPGDKDEYEELKKTKPSYTDIFTMNKLDDYFDDQYGVFAKVIRLKDKRKFQLPLADIKTIESDSKNHQLLDDYTVWAVNY